MQRDELTYRVIGCAIEVHRHLGPGLLESAYEACMAQELGLSGLAFQQQRSLAVSYKGLSIDCGYRLDLVVERQLIVELKSLDDLAPIHEAQLLTYMKLAGIPTGLLINFNVRQRKEGIKRFVL